MITASPLFTDTIVPGVMQAGGFDGTPMQLRQVVLDQITTYPETHDQRDWVSACGTTACVAGYALLFQLGYIPIGDAFDVLEEAQHLLDLDDYDAMRLFHYTTKEQARHALKFLANGDPVDWASIGHKLTKHGEHQVDLMVKHDVAVYRGCARGPRHLLPQVE